MLCTDIKLQQLAFHVFTISNRDLLINDKVKETMNRELQYLIDIEFSVSVPTLSLLLKVEEWERSIFRETQSV